MNKVNIELSLEDLCDQLGVDFQYLLNLYLDYDSETVVLEMELPDTELSLDPAGELYYKEHRVTYANPNKKVTTSFSFIDEVPSAVLDKVKELTLAL